jgi:glycine cleavage system H protein
MTVYYTKDHEWVWVEGDIGTVGISDHAQEQLGDIVSVQLPEIGRVLAKGDEAAVVDSTKAASEVYAPIGGEVIERNEELEGAPERVNKEAEGAAWFFKLRLSDAGEVEGLMDRDAYESFLETLS